LRLGLDRGDLEARGLQRLLEGFGFGADADVETLDAFAVGADQPRLEALAARRDQSRGERPLLARYEFFDFQFPVADQPQCDRLHASG
jgi:hypothetical protein